MRPVLLTFKDPDKEELVSTEKATFFACRKVFVTSLLRIWISLSLCQNILVKKIIEATISYKIRIWTHVMGSWLVTFGMKVMKLNTWYDCSMETISDTFPQQASLHGCVIETPFGDFGKKKWLNRPFLSYCSLVWNYSVMTKLCAKLLSLVQRIMSCGGENDTHIQCRRVKYYFSEFLFDLLVQRSFNCFYVII